MQHSEAGFTSQSGLQLSYQQWTPDAGVRAVIVLLHGAADHCGRYARLGEIFAAQGYALAALDLPGHGRSEGVRGYISSFDECLQALDEFRALLLLRFPDSPQILLGHSMGGLIATRYLLDRQDEFSACVLSAAAIKTDLQPGRLTMGLLRVLSALLPKLGVLKLDASGVSRDPVEVQRYLDDPLVYTGKLRARLVMEMFRAMSAVESGAARLKLPLLILHGAEDAMTSPEGSRYLHDRAGSTAKQLKIYPGLYHEIFNEPERLQVFQDIFDWLDDRGF